MTWTTLGPGGSASPAALALFAVTAAALVYACGLFYKVFRLYGAEPYRVEPEPLEDEEEDEA